MKSKSKLFIVTLLSALMVLATIFGFGSLKQEKAGFNGIYSGEFTALAEEETQGEVGVVQGKLSTDGAYLLLATPLTIADFGEYTAVGYEISKDGQALVADGLESNAYYTGITVNTANGTTTWTMADIFGESATGMIVAEIEFNAESFYSVKPYAIKGEEKVYGAEQSVDSRATTEFEAEHDDVVLVSTAGVTKRPAKGVIGGISTTSGVLAGTSITFNVNADEDSTASLFIHLSKRAVAYAFNSVYKVLVNGDEIQTDAIVPSDGNEEWTVFVPVDLGVVALEEGANVIVIETVKNSSSAVGSDMDKISFKTNATLTLIHTCQSICVICGGCEDSACQETACQQKCACYVSSDATEYVFEAEDSNPVGWHPTEMKIVEKAAASGGKRIGGCGNTPVAGKGYYFTFEVYAEEAGAATLYFGLGSDAAFAVSSVLPTSVNGKTVETTAQITAVGWEAYTKFEIADVKLVKGDNVIKIVIGSGALINMDYIALKSDVVLTEIHKCESVCVLCGGCEDSACQETVCQQKCVGHTVSSTATEYKFEAEDSNPVGWHPTEMKIVEKAAASGGKRVGGCGNTPVAGKGYYFTFEVYAEEAGAAILYFGLGSNVNAAASAIFPTTINGKAITTSAQITKVGWDVYTKFEIATVKLQAGLNVIKLVIGSDALINMDYISLKADVALSATAFE